MSGRAWIHFFAVVLLVAAAKFGLAQDGLQINVQYVCPDGSTYVVHSCTATPKGELCSYQRDQNSERYNRRVDVANQMRTCTVRGAAARAVAPNSSDYTNDLPSVDRVERSIRGVDTTDTMERQIATFQALAQYIDRIKYARTVRGPYTPAEQNLRNAYQSASHQISQDYAKSHTAAETAEFDRAAARYILDKGLYDEYHRLIGSQAASSFDAAQATLDAAARRQQQGMTPTSSANSGSRNGTVVDSQGIFAREQAKLESDPEVRRCLELGGSVDHCEGTDLTGIANVAQTLAAAAIGVDTSAQRSVNGVILVGQYHSRSDLPELTLTPDGKATLQKCGSLVDAEHSYALRRSGASTQIIVTNEPSPIVLTLNADGSLSGPGIITAKGRIISGYNNQYACTTGTPAANCRTTSVPIYAPSMQRCMVRQLAPQAAPPPRPEPALNGLANMFGISSEPAAPTIYGLRVAGTYADPTGMKLAFSNGFVTVDCGRAHVNAPYRVENTPPGFVIHVENGGGPFALEVAQDHTLRGSGSTTVNGRLVSSFHDEEVRFAPHSESCQVGVFGPQGTEPGTAGRINRSAAAPQVRRPEPR